MLKLRKNINEDVIVSLIYYLAKNLFECNGRKPEGDGWKGDKERHIMFCLLCC